MSKLKTVELDAELQQIIASADNVSPLELDIPIEKLEDILEPIKDIQDPETAYKLYYSTYQRLLRKYLPKQNEFKSINKIIRKQGCLYLKEGHTSGRDSRQAYFHRLKTISNVIIEWGNTTKGRDLFKLYNAFCDLNKV